MFQIDAISMLYNYMIIGMMLSLFILIIDSRTNQDLVMPTKQMYMIVIIVFTLIMALSWPFMLFEAFSKKKKVE